MYHVKLHVTSQLNQYSEKEQYYNHMIMELLYAVAECILDELKHLKRNPLERNYVSVGNDTVREH